MALNPPLGVNFVVCRTASGVLKISPFPSLNGSEFFSPLAAPVSLEGLSREFDLPIIEDFFFCCVTKALSSGSSHESCRSFGTSRLPNYLSLSLIVNGTGTLFLLVGGFLFSFPFSS